MTEPCVRARLADPALADRAAELGFRGPDVQALVAAVAAVADRPDGVAAVAGRAEALVQRIGDFEAGAVHAAGQLAMLALLVSAPEVAAFHTARGVPGPVSVATLADLGQQVWVHRQTYGEFGLHTQGWLALVWSGALYRLGRLQFNLEHPSDGRPGWVLGTHIPRTGPLTPAEVDDSLQQAVPFFAAHFPEHPVREISCRSWLLDPALAEALPGSNLAAFQRRWEPYGSTDLGDADVLFFVFSRRDPVELDELPTDTSLRRAVVERWRAGGHWSVVTGRLRP